jgi:peptide/nickel transport system substrate-binding protein
MGPSMFPHGRCRRASWRLIGATAAAVAMCVSAMAATASEAAVGTQKNTKIDKNGVLKIGLQINDQGGVFFDPAADVPNPYAREWIELIYGTMILNTPDGKGAPGLATKWSTPDASTVELTLREGVKFTDGSPLNAAAVKGAWDRLLANPPSTLPPSIKAFSSIEAVNNNTVRIKLSQPIAPTVVNETLRDPYRLGVMSPASIAARTVNTKPVGAGPYQLESHPEGGEIALTKNPSFYDPKRQYFARVQFIPSSPGAPQVSALQAGAANLIWNFPPDAITAIKAQKGLEVSSETGTRVFDIGLCTSPGRPFASKEARQAFQYAIDRDAINQAGMDGAGDPTILPLSSKSSFYNPKLEKTYTYDPKKAKKLLQKAGIAPGTKITGLSTGGAPQPAISEVVQSNLEAVGFDVELSRSTNLTADALRLLPDMTFAAMDPTLWQFAINGTSALNTCA